MLSEKNKASIGLGPRETAVVKRQCGKHTVGPLLSNYLKNRKIRAKIWSHHAWLNVFLPLKEETFMLQQEVAWF